MPECMTIHTVHTTRKPHTKVWGFSPIIFTWQDSGAGAMVGKLVLLQCEKIYIIISPRLYHNMSVCNSYNMGTSDLPEIYARGHTAPDCKCVAIFQANQKCPCYITNISHCPCRLIAYLKATQALLNLLYKQPWEIRLWICSKNIVATCII